MSGIYFDKTFARGFGTYPLEERECEVAIETAADVGFRAYDTAQMYNNESACGRAFASCGIRREELFITTKVDPCNYSPERFLSSVESSLAQLRLDCVDVLLLHWPPADFNIKPALELLGLAQQKGFTHHVGVSNFTAQMMRDAKDFLGIPIAVNQVEFHPLLNQNVLLTTSADTGIPLSSYCSIARGEIFKHSMFSDIGVAYGKSPAQVAQRWILQKGVSINTMSTKRANIHSNFDIDDFQLSAEHMANIDAMTSQNYRIVNKTLVPFAPDFD